MCVLGVTGLCVYASFQGLMTLPCQYQLNSGNKLFKMTVRAEPAPEHMLTQLRKCMNRRGRLVVELELIRR